MMQNPFLIGQIDFSGDDEGFKVVGNAFSEILGG